MRKKPLISTVLILVAAISTYSITAKETKPDSSPSVADDLIVHEWGTFTTFSGSDGVFLDFRPLAQESDLPPFVLDRASFSSSPIPIFAKRRIRGRVRMETPVTYFYTDRIQDVNVSVDFPEGLLTEFYPPVKNMLPKFDPKAAYGEGEPMGKSRLDWGKVQLIPTSALVPGIEDPKLRSQIANHISHAALPNGPNDRHYSAARATDSALVHVVGNTPPNSPNFPNFQLQPASHLEKFLFYRGVGNFELPFKTVFGEQGEIMLRNEGELAMSSAILIRVEGDSISTATIASVDGGKTRTFDTPRKVDANELSKIVIDALVGEGLYLKEAQSMVQTWKQSWFTEQGTRVMYMVPESITNELLPLHITPRPKQMRRVLVGRMEVMSPELEQKLSKAVAASHHARAAFLAQVEKKENKQEAYPIPESIRSFGRLAEPALVRIATISRDQTVRGEASFLLTQLRQE